jgi:aminoglycoside phosphotransferase (APT) family kinase protein
MSDGELNWPALVATFGLTGAFKLATPHGSGHINDTYAISLLDRDGMNRRYIFQRINDRVFGNIPALMENISRVTAHISKGMRLHATITGHAFHRDDKGSCWRCYDFIEGASSHDMVESPHQAREAAYSFGEFQRQLVDLPDGRLHETIPNFHHTRRRFNHLLDAIHADVKGRKADVAEEIAFALSRESMVDHLLNRVARGEIPERITHNDTKINNVMLDDATGVGIAVIDLDTVMPGLAMYDFGDMVRTAANSAAEDETDLTKVDCRMEIFDALAEGYLNAAGRFLHAAEISELELGARLMTFENGIRFLTDHLQGDTYYKIHRPNQNLDRARCQFALVRSMEVQAEEMRGIIVDRTAG